MQQVELQFPDAANDHVYRVRTYRLKHESKYLSAEWERTRRIALARAQWKCERCQTRSHLEVHHIEAVAEYPELFHVLSNLMVLCYRCHQCETMKQALRYGWRYTFR